MTLSSWPKPWRRYFCRRLPRCLRRRWNCYPQFLKAKVASPQQAHRAQVRSHPGTGSVESCSQSLTLLPGCWTLQMVKRLGRGSVVSQLKQWGGRCEMSGWCSLRVSGLVCLEATLHLSYQSCHLWLAHPGSTSGREASAVASLSKEETKARKNKVVRNASLLPVPDHGMESLYRFRFTQPTLCPGKNQKSDTAETWTQILLIP